MIVRTMILCNKLDTVLCDRVENLHLKLKKILSRTRRVVSKIL